jgi:hypothetical protein
VPWEIAISAVDATALDVGRRYRVRHPAKHVSVVPQLCCAPGIVRRCCGRCEVFAHGGSYHAPPLCGFARLVHQGNVLHGSVGLADQRFYEPQEVAPKSPHGVH